VENGEAEMGERKKHGNLFYGRYNPQFGYKFYAADITPVALCANLI
jgi:hypothetical protein